MLLRNRYLFGSPFVAERTNQLASSKFYICQYYNFPKPLASRDVGGFFRFLQYHPTQKHKSAVTS